MFAVTAACNAVLGLDERPSRSHGTGGETSAGGTGGAAGATGSTGGSGGAASVGGAGGSGGSCTPMPDTCGGVGELDDDFEDGSVSIRWNCAGQTGTTIAETGGGIEITLPDEPVDNRSAWCETERYYDLVDRALVVRVDEMANTAVNARVFFELYGVDGTRVSLQQRMGDIQVVIDPGANPQFPSTTPYDDAERFWRFRETCGVLHWEVSADGMSWNEIHQVASSSLFDMRYVRPRFGVTVAPGVVGSGTTRFDDLDGQPDAVACPIADFVDDFSDGVLSGAWARGDTSGCTISEPGGELKMQLESTVGSACIYASSEGFDMRDGSVSVRALQHPSAGSPANAWLSVATRPSTGIVMGYELGLLFMGRVDDGSYTPIGAVAYDDANMGWWRLREASGQTFFETSSNGTSWTERASTANVYDMSSLDVVLGSEVEANLSGGFDVRFDDINTTP